MRTVQIGEDVLGRDGRKLGSVDRLVVDPTAHRITHIVVGGHLVGVNRASDDARGRLSVDLTPDALARLPEAHPGLVAPPGEQWRPPPGYARENFLRVLEGLVGGSPYVPPVQIDLDTEPRHEIKAGSPVWSGVRQLGRVARVEAEPDGTIRELVVRHSLLDGERRVPVDRVTEVVGTNVHVDLSEEEFEALPRD
jgi:hypothetical protein